MDRDDSQRLASTAPELHRALTTEQTFSPVVHEAADIRCQTLWVTMRDGVRLATDVYFPPRVPAPAVAMRTPYGRANPKMLGSFRAMAQRGYIVIAQDCRGTGDSEPDAWDYYVYEPEDGWDFVEWVSHQDWFDGFLGACGSSYVAQTQWCMAMHPRMSAIVPEVSGIGVAPRMAKKYMFYNAYARSVGKGTNKVSMSYEELERYMVPETLAGGYFNEPAEQPLPATILESYPELRSLPVARARQWLWEHYCKLPCARRADLVKQALGATDITILEIEALTAIFGLHIPHDAYTVPHPERANVCHRLQAPALLITGWYDWSMNDALATWHLMMRTVPEPRRSQCRLIITPSAHNTPGYHEGEQAHPELRHSHRVPEHAELLMRWYAAVREQALDHWPKVIYYLMGANEWFAASAWPPPRAREQRLHIHADGALRSAQPGGAEGSSRYVYDPEDPTPTVGGSIVSYVYPPGSVDVSAVQTRADVLVFSTEPLPESVDVVGPLRLILYASSSAVDTDFSARLSDVFPDGRAIQLQTGIVRARFRNANGEVDLLEPGRIYRFEIDMWATANRFAAGHRIRLDISSADFPRFERNTNLGGAPGPAIRAEQTIYHDAEHPSHLAFWVLGRSDIQ